MSEESGAERIQINPERPPERDCHYLLVGSTPSGSVAVEIRQVITGEEIVLGGIEMLPSDWHAVSDWISEENGE